MVGFKITCAYSAVSEFQAIGGVQAPNSKFQTCCTYEKAMSVQLKNRIYCTHKEYVHVIEYQQLFCIVDVGHSGRHIIRHIKQTLCLIGITLQNSSCSTKILHHAMNMDLKSRPLFFIVDIPCDFCVSCLYIKISQKDLGAI